MAIERHLYLSPEDYLAREREAPFRSEYRDGRSYAMAGASLQHSLIAGNIVTELNLCLADRDCGIHPSDLRVLVPATRLYTYPDAVVVCGDYRFDDDHQDTVLNPVVLVEIISESTEAYDRGEKFRDYQTIPSLLQYVLVDQYSQRIERFARREDGEWYYTAVESPDGVLRLDSIGCALRLERVYRKVRFRPRRARSLIRLEEVDGDQPAA